MTAWLWEPPEAAEPGRDVWVAGILFRWPQPLPVVRCTVVERGERCRRSPVDPTPWAEGDQPAFYLVGDEVAASAAMGANLILQRCPFHVYLGNRPGSVPVDWERVPADPPFGAAYGEDDSWLIAAYLAQVACDPATPEELAVSIACDGSRTVRLAVLERPDCPDALRSVAALGT